MKLNMSGGDIANVALSPEGCEFVSCRCRCWRGPKTRQRCQDVRVGYFVLGLC